MNTKKNKKEAKTLSEFLDNVTEFFLYSEELDQEELKAELREEGIDPEELLSKVRMLVQSKLKEAKKDWIKAAHKKREALLKIMESAKFSIPKTPSALRAQIKELISGVYGTEVQGFAHAYFRNLDKITDEDLITLYEDFMRLEFLEKYPEENEKGVPDDKS